MTKRNDRIGRLTRIVCALALILLGFAHTPPRLAAIPVSEFAAYVLPDGSVPALCDLTHAGDDAQGKFHAPDRCEACLLCASTLLPPPPTLAVPPRRIAQTLRPDETAVGFVPAFRLTAAPRGPPALLLA